MLDLTGARVRGQGRHRPVERLVPGLRHRHADSSSGEDAAATWLEGMADNDAPHVREQQRHRRGRRPRRGRRWASSTTTTTTAFQRRTPACRAATTSFAAGDVGGLVIASVGQRARRAPTRTRRRQRLHRVSCSTRRRRATSPSETFEYPLAAGVRAAAEACRRSTSLRLARLDLDAARRRPGAHGGADRATAASHERLSAGRPPAPGAGAGTRRERPRRSLRRGGRLLVALPCSPRRSPTWSSATWPRAGRWRDLADEALRRPARPDPRCSASSVAAASAVSGTALAWLVMRTDLPGPAACCACCCRCRWCCRRSSARSRCVAAFAPGGLLAELLEPLGVDGLPACEGFAGACPVLTLLTYPYVYLPVAARLRRCRRRSRRRPAARARGPRRVPRRWCCRRPRRRSRPATLLVFLYVDQRLRRGPAAALRHADPRHLRQPRCSTRPLAASLEPACWGCWPSSWCVGRAGGSPGAGPRRGWPRARPLRGAARPLAGAGVRAGRRAARGLALVAPLAVLGLVGVRGAGDRVGPAGTSIVRRRRPGRAGRQHRRGVSGRGGARGRGASCCPVAYLTMRHRSRLGGAANAARRRRASPSRAS